MGSWVAGIPLQLRGQVADMKQHRCRPIVNGRADDHCERCGVHASVRGLTLHHRVKRSQGGSWSPVNCVMLCGHGTTPDGCHSWVEHNPNAAEEEGFHVRPWNDPGDTPVLLHHGWVLLADDGTWEPAERAA